MPVVPSNSVSKISSYGPSANPKRAPTGYASIGSTARSVADSYNSRFGLVRDELKRKLGNIEDRYERRNGRLESIGKIANSFVDLAGKKQALATKQANMDANIALADRDAFLYKAANGYTQEDGTVVQGAYQTQYIPKFGDDKGSNAALVLIDKSNEWYKGDVYKNLNPEAKAIFDMKVREVDAPYFNKANDITMRAAAKDRDDRYKRSVDIAQKKVENDSSYESYKAGWYDTSFNAYQNAILQGYVMKGYAEESKDGVVKFKQPYYEEMYRDDWTAAYKTSNANLFGKVYDEAVNAPDEIVGEMKNALVQIIGGVEVKNADGETIITESNLTPEDEAKCKLALEKLDAVRLAAKKEKVDAVFARANSDAVSSLLSSKADKAGYNVVAGMMEKWAGTTAEFWHIDEKRSSDELNKMSNFLVYAIYGDELRTLMEEPVGTVKYKEAFDTVSRDTFAFAEANKLIAEQMATIDKRMSAAEAKGRSIEAREKSENSSDADGANESGVGASSSRRRTSKKETEPKYSQDDIRANVLSLARQSSDARYMSEMTDLFSKYTRDDKSDLSKQIIGHLRYNSAASLLYAKDDANGAKSKFGSQIVSAVAETLGTSYEEVEKWIDKESPLYGVADWSGDITEEPGDIVLKDGADENMRALLNAAIDFATIYTFDRNNPTVASAFESSKQKNASTEITGALKDAIVSHLKKYQSKVAGSALHEMNIKWIEDAMFRNGSQIQSLITIE